MRWNEYISLLRLKPDEIVFSTKLSRLRCALNGSAIQDRDSRRNISKCTRSKTITNNINILLHKLKMQFVPSRKIFSNQLLPYKFSLFCVSSTSHDFLPYYVRKTLEDCESICIYIHRDVQNEMFQLFISGG